MPGVQSAQPLLPDSSATVTLKYFLGSNANTNDTPILAVVNMSPPVDPSPDGTQVHILRGMFLPDNTFLLNFNTASNITYYVQYSDDLMTWKTSVYPVNGTGYPAQWIDFGPPATDSLPRTRAARFYRIIQVVY
jgi:hypothetical protein